MSSNFNDKNMDRRKFLRFTGTCALAALMGSACTSIDDQEGDAAIQTCPYGMSYDRYPGQCLNYIDSNNSGYCDFSEDSSLEQPAQHDESAVPATQEATTVQPTSQPTAAQPTQIPQSTQELVVLCQRGCSYPGHCRRFRDNDGSGICDLSEGINPSEL
jgi:hypothetical protein